MIKRIEPKKLSGNEIFVNGGSGNMKVVNFWQYAFSSLNSNLLRGSLAEFLVENALNGSENIGVRNSWGDFDVLYKNNKIEVKCCSYIQDWDQDKLSKIVFSGLKAKDLYWSSAVSPFQKDDQKKYKADIYILALEKHQDLDSLNILDLNQWCFYILDRETLGKITKNGSSISLLTLEKSKITPVSFDKIKRTVDGLLETA